MKKLVALLLFGPLLGFAQYNGIKFEQSLSWQEIKAKAILEKKLIFVDCYTTWCGPCKWMDINVYPKDTVGEYLNSRFISVKIQMDSTKMDNDITKNRYSIAQYFKEKYNVKAFPTYLFFSPDGEIVHKDIGIKRVKDFCLLAANATNPLYQYYTLLNKYQDGGGERDYATIPYLAYKARILDEDLSKKIAYDYIHNYLDTLSEKAFLTKDKILFCTGFIQMLNSKDRLFTLCYHEPEKVDSITGNVGIAKQSINYIIKKEFIYPSLNKAKNGGIDPDWKKISRTIRGKYGKGYSTLNIYQEKVEWYKYKKKWRAYAKYIIKEVEEQDPLRMRSSYAARLFLNNKAFEVFQYSKRKRELGKALLWTDHALLMTNAPDADIMDTKANLLYKLGKKPEAIILEEQAVSLSPQSKIMKEVVYKMKSNLPTWLVNDRN